MKRPFGAPAGNDDRNANAVVAFDAGAALAAARPRVHVGEADEAAHALRLEAIRKKAGRCVWDAA